jgi:polysaccharide deacetylase family protein (PEP-CTERM system associated)
MNHADRRNSERIFSVDVEEYFHAENVLTSLSREKLGTLPSRVEVGTQKILDLLGRYGSKATFFVLGCVAKGKGRLIKEIMNAGHEIASHGYQHIPLYRHTRGSFEEDLGASVKILEDLTGQKCLGYRATSFSLSDETPWFFDILRKHGIVYDSSISFSFFRPTFKKAIENRGWFEISEGIIEFPVSFVKLGLFGIPLGGGYFRAYPNWLSRMGLQLSECSGRIPSMFYIHPWELDPGQPRFRISPVKYFRHYVNLGGTERKLEKLLATFRFSSVRDTIDRFQTKTYKQ